MLDTLSLSINEVETINSFESEIFATVYGRGIVSAELEVILNPQGGRRHDLNGRFELVDDDSTFSKGIRRHTE